MNILFIGNSYTYFNYMPKLFEIIAKDNKKDISVFSVTKGDILECEHKRTNRLNKITV